MADAGSAKREGANPKGRGANYYLVNVLKKLHKNVNWTKKGCPSLAVTWIRKHRYLQETFFQYLQRKYWIDNLMYLKQEID